MENKKYEFVSGSEITISEGVELMRIRALRDFGDVKKGDIGGYIQSEDNLSHDGNCWVYGEARVYDNARVNGEARVYDNARVYGEAGVYDNAKVYDNARVNGEARVYDDAKVYEYAEMYNNARVYGYAEVYGEAEVYGDARVYYNAGVYGSARVSGNAKVKGTDDYIVFKNWWSSGRYFTWTRSNNMWKVGCFYGTGEELIQKAYADSERSGREYERIVKYVEEILRDEKE